MIQLPETEHQVMTSLAGCEAAEIAQLAAALGVDQSLVHAACTTLAEHQLVRIERQG